jgi:predicted DNA-binding transcriptional regulator AlpA
VSPKPIREQIEAAKQLDYVTIEQLSLLSNISVRTLWRRLADGTFPHTLRNKGITRVHRASALHALRPINTNSL